MICRVMVPRLIPARAGNTWIRRLVRRLLRAHPRSRGEHSQRCYIPPVHWGSSPLARGTHGDAVLYEVSVGLIPARAGNTLTCCWYFFSARAHPRSRGEHARSSSTRVTTQGSSPLARGTPGETPWVKDLTGLIPARAGNTFPGASPIPGSRAHPRSRGEHSSGFLLTNHERRSSPLARGTLSGDDQPSMSIGLIPARAGNTDCCFGALGDWGAHPRSRGEHT